MTPAPGRNVQSAMCDVRCEERTKKPAPPAPGSSPSLVAHRSSLPPDLDDTDLASCSAASPSDIIPDAALRRRVERLLAETPTPPDSWIDRELEAHYGELSPGEQIACRRQCRHYLAAVIGRDQIVNRKF